MNGQTQVIRLFAICVSAILLNLSSGCSNNTGYVGKYGLAYNSEREKRGISTIPSTWTIQDMGSFFDCFEPKPILDKPHRLSKRVVIGKDGEIVEEVDHFYSGKSFVFDQTTLSQEVQITYDYSKERNGNPWQALASLGPDHVSESISMQEADHLLTSWGLKRKN